MASILPISKSSRGGHDDRDALRQAIELRKRAAKAAADHRTAIDRARDLVVAAERRAERAARGVEEAKAESTRLAVEAIRTGSDDTGAGIVRAARAVEVQELDAVEMARAALAQLQASTVDVDAALMEAGVNITIAVNNLLLPLGRDAFEKLKALDAERYRLAVLLRFVQETNHEKVVSSPLGSTHQLLLEKKLHGVLDGLCSELSDHFSRSIVPDAAATRAWQAVREELRSNADAPLPTLCMSSPSRSRPMSLPSRLRARYARRRDTVVVKTSQLAPRIFRMLPTGAGHGVTVAEIVTRLGGRSTEDSVRRILKRLVAAKLVAGGANRKLADRRAQLFHRLDGAAFSHEALASVKAAPPRQPQTGTAILAQVFDAVPIQPDAVSVSQIVSAIDRTPETIRRLLKALMQARLVERKIGRAPLFYRMPGVVFSETALTGAAPQVKMRIGNWYRDGFGNLVRQIKGEAADDDDPSTTVRRHGQAGGLATARARTMRKRKSKLASRTRSARPTPAGEAKGMERIAG